MCGISGILYHDRARRPEQRVVEAMTDALAHRGPDERGCHIDGPAALGNRRLSIIDIASGHQPMCNEDGAVWITYNGEVYNYAELRDELSAKGYRFRTRSDTEVVLHLYEETGEECVERLRGMFGFAIWDKRQETLLLARDRLGIKPLYYFAGDEFLAFGSEIRALLQAESVPRRLNVQALHDYLTFHYNIAPATMFDGILKVPPGHVLIARRGEVKLRRYWDLDFSRKVAMSEDDCVAEFRQRFVQVTKSHLMSEVPLGVLLSGGLDSTVVTAVASELVGRPVKTFSVAFADDGDDYDERFYARLAARHYATDHHEIAITHRDFREGLPGYIEHTEEPMADSASIPLYYVSRLAREHVTVVLSGEGSDELFGGYMGAADFRGFDRARRVRRIPRLVRDHLLDPLNTRVIGSPRIARYLELARRPLSHYPLRVPLYMGGVLSEEAKWALYGERVKARGGLRRSEDLVVDAYRNTLDLEFLDQMLYVYTKQWLPDDLLLKADKMTMAHSLELRVPFLDHTLVEFVASLPPDLKLRRNGHGGGITKYVLRKAFGEKTPAPILNRTKLGFPVPITRLLRDELKEVAWDVLQSRSLRESGLFDPTKVATLLEEHEAGRDHAAALWLLLVFGLWSRHFQVTA
ncbi:MAG: asparagine synthase (glutamine-hydrolyzing) [Candidatus Rokubacteria bacterium]|nr:asparagine synthase (glutamine-hydrolyzing) [Candidatus Rokubacteria bacterium]